MTAKPEHEEFQCLYHAKSDSQITEHDRRLQKIDETSDKIFERLDNIQGKLIGRPGWGVCIIITILTTAIGIAISIILKK